VSAARAKRRGPHDKRRTPSELDAGKPSTAVDRSPIGLEPKMRHIIEDAFFGSKNLCAAILATGRTHGPMTPEQQIAAVEYAHSVKVTDTVVKRVSNTPPRTLRLSDWNLSK
jgi:hypothetical protein